MSLKRIGTGPALIILSVLFILLPRTSSGQDPLESIHINLRANNKVLHELLDDMTDQTGYYFTFDSRIIDSRQQLNMVLRNISIRYALDTIFGNPDLNYKVINKNIVIYPTVSQTMPDSLQLEEEKPGYIEILGNITDSRNKKPLPYATVGILNSSYGTISNLNGDFVLRLPDTLQHPILAISFIGYRNYYQPVSINSNELILVKMTKRLISLQEVIIRYQDPVTLVQESIARIDENYMDQKAGVISYYREKVQKDEKCLLFSEAVVEIDKASYASFYSNERSRILKGRKITNVDESDTLLLKIRSGIKTMLELDIANQHPDFLMEDFPFRYDYSFDNVVSFQDKLVYVLRFKPKSVIDETLFQGKLYLDRESLAIVAADFEYDPVRISKESDMFVSRKDRGVRVKPLSAKYYVEYKQSPLGYHLNQVHGEVSFKLRKKRQWISSKYTIKLEMAVTEIDPGNPPQIKLIENLKPNVILSDEVFIYDQDFWGDYNTIAPETSLQEALQRIEISMQEISE